jgi:HD-GYP domain-containing protein (c-di-GMP phosphodiesterase class II)
VSHTYEFLKQIAWTDNLAHVTTIAHCHHEKMDGSGYPRRIRGDKIPIQSRMMTIADIYDALTAFDRPYKKSLSAARALEILIKDARAGKVDGYLLKIFIEAGVFHNATLGTKKKAS